MDCRRGCGACCIAISISSPMPGLPLGKPAGQRCPHLTLGNDCSIFDDPRRPAVCDSLMPRLDMCGDNREFALTYLAQLEQRTAPAR
jgi:Fe-S-cluster containining protein